SIMPLHLKPGAMPAAHVPDAPSLVPEVELVDRPINPTSYALLREHDSMPSVAQLVGSHSRLATRHLCKLPPCTSLAVSVGRTSPSRLTLPSASSLLSRVT